MKYEAGFPASDTRGMHGMKVNKMETWIGVAFLVFAVTAFAIIVGHKGIVRLADWKDGEVELLILLSLALYAIGLILCKETGVQFLLNMGLAEPTIASIIYAVVGLILGICSAVILMWVCAFLEGVYILMRGR